MKKKPGRKGFGFRNVRKAKALCKYLGIPQTVYNPGAHVVYHRLQDIRGEFRGEA